LSQSTFHGGDVMLGNQPDGRIAGLRRFPCQHTG
jgi:hypothetical protein